MHPLPRSLDPIAGESLVSYLQRLAYRIDVSPLRLARMAGLHGWSNNSPPARAISLELGREQLSNLARLTRITLEEAEELTFSSWKSHYPPIKNIIADNGSRSDSWLFTGTPRFCPRCLDRGAWKKEWSLPVVFACIEHRIFLHAICPQCARLSERPWQLLQRPNDHTLHPAQCRQTTPGIADHKRKSAACGYRLDRADISGLEIEPVLLDFQIAITRRLNPQSVPEEPGAYFTDLRLIMALINSAWPHTSTLIHAELVNYVDAYIQSETKTRNGPLGSPQRYRILSDPPREARTCAALMQAADALLLSDDLPESLPRFIDSPSAERFPRKAWANVFEKHRDSCSEKLRAAATPAAHRYRRVRMNGPRAPLRDDYQPQHIPAYLEQKWFDSHFGHITGIHIRALRRTAAVQLVQWVNGGSMGDAAQFLGINHAGVQYAPITDLRYWAGTRRKLAEFETALHELAAELRTSSVPPIDYRRRRAVLRDWVLPPETWRRISNELPPNRGGAPIMDDRKRQVASVFVWTHVTQGEHLFAPRPLEREQPPDTQRIWALRRNTTWFQMTRRDAYPHFADLRKALAECAAQLALSIDNGESIT